MKNLRKVQFGLLAVLLAVGVVFGMSAFTSKKVTTLTYRYIGTSETDLTDLTKWVDVSNEENPAPCESGIQLPCLVQFHDDEYADIDDFITTNDTKAEMFASSRVISKKD